MKLFRPCLVLLASISCLHAAPKPNIIFILTDDLGYGDYGVFFQNLRKQANDRQEPWHITPELDKMAADGVQLRHYYCPAPVCAPSRGSLLHGVHQGHANIRDNQFDRELGDNHTLASVLRSAGYATAAIGKWGLQGNSRTGPDKDKANNAPGEIKYWPSYPTKRGFDFFHGFVRHKDGHRHYPLEDKKELWENDKEISADFALSFTTDFFTARAKKWISDQKEATPEKPFFLYLAYDTPHAILQLPPCPFPKEGLKWLGQKGKMVNTSTGKIDSYIHPDYANATWDHDKNPETKEEPWPDVYKRYAGNVRRIDNCVGDLLKHLKDLGIGDDTLVVFTTDNGPSKESYLPEAYHPDFFNSFGPFDGIKRDVWEGGVRAGALVHWPAGAPKGQVSDFPCQAHDWLATFSELAGIGTPARSDGASLVPTLTGKGEQVASQVYVEYVNGSKSPSYQDFNPERRNAVRKQMQMIRFGDHVGVRYHIKSHADPFEIYNIVKDPKQSENLAKKKPKLQQKMHDEVLRLRRPAGNAKRPYDKEFVPSIAGLVSQAGLSYATYADTAPWLVRLDDLETISSGHADSIEEVMVKKDEPTLIMGYLEVPKDGVYHFNLKSDGHALLRIHNATVIDAAFHQHKKNVKASIRLKAGKHPIRVYRKDSGKGFELLMKSDSKDDFAPIAKSALTH